MVVYELATCPKCGDELLRRGENCRTVWCAKSAAHIGRDFLDRCDFTGVILANGMVEPVSKFEAAVVNAGRAAATAADKSNKVESDPPDNEDGETRAEVRRRAALNKLRGPAGAAAARAQRAIDNNKPIVDGRSRKEIPENFGDGGVDTKADRVDFFLEAIDRRCRRIEIMAVASIIIIIIGLVWLADQIS